MFMETEKAHTDEITHKKMEELLMQNSELIAENNKLLKKIHRNGVWSFWTRIIWYVVMIGLPFALYFYVLEPYFTALGSSYETFSAGMQEIPGLRIIMDILAGAKNQ
jgi:uncharacterized membrane protein